MFKLQLTDQYDRYDGVQWSHQPGLRITITIHYNQTNTCEFVAPALSDRQEGCKGENDWGRSMKQGLVVALGQRETNKSFVSEVIKLCPDPADFVLPLEP